MGLRSLYFLTPSVRGSTLNARICQISASKVNPRTETVKNGRITYTTCIYQNKNPKRPYLMYYHLTYHLSAPRRPIYLAWFIDLTITMTVSITVHNITYSTETIGNYSYTSYIYWLVTTSSTSHIEHHHIKGTKNRIWHYYIIGRYDNNYSFSEWAIMLIIMS